MSDLFTDNLIQLALGFAIVACACLAGGVLFVRAKTARERVKIFAYAAGVIAAILVGAFAQIAGHHPTCIYDEHGNYVSGCRYKFPNRSPLTQ